MDTTPTTTTAHPNLKPWKPGQSGNPSGRPSRAEWTADYIASLEDGKALEAYVGQLHALATGKHNQPKLRLEAIKILLDRLLGKALETMKVSGSLTTLDPARLARLSDAELEQAAILVAKLLAEEG